MSDFAQIKRILNSTSTTSNFPWLKKEINPTQNLFVTINADGKPMAVKTEIASFGQENSAHGYMNVTVKYGRTSLAHSYEWRGMPDASHPDLLRFKSLTDFLDQVPIVFQIQRKQPLMPIVPLIKLE